MARVLVVDDEDIVRTPIRILLKMLGHSVDEVSDGLRAAARFEKYRHDLVVSDLWLPGQDGLALIGDILDIDHRARIIVISGDVEALKRARDLGVRQVMCKPLNMNEFKAAVEKEVGAQVHSCRVA